MRRVSGETVQRLPVLGRRSALGPGPSAALAGERGAKGCSATAEGAAGAAAGSTVAVSIPDAIECFDLGEIRIDVLKFLAQTLDVTVDRPVVDIDVLAIGRIHQLVAHDDRFAMRVLPLARELAAPDQGPDALDQEPLRKRLPDVVVGAHAQTEQFVDFVVL